MQTRSLRRLSTLAVIGGLIALPLLRPEPLRGGAIIRRFDLTPGAPACVGIQFCGTDACDDARTVCQSFAADGLGSNCVEPGQDLYCCASAPCPSVGGFPATCEVVENTETSAALALCVYPHFELCDPMLTVTRVRACFTDTSGAFVSAWADGNCDGDRFPNATDPDPCMPEVAPDGGVPFSDGGTPTDAGASFDASIDSDASISEDGAIRDAGATRRDASRTSHGFVFRGSGGCACSAPGG